MALTPAERQARRRAKIAAELAAQHPGQTIVRDGRESHQQAWDAACEELEHQLELYRAYLALHPVQAKALRPLDLPRLAAMTLTLSLIQFATSFGDDVYLSSRPLADPAITGLDPHTLRQRLLADDPPPEPDRFPRTPADDASALAWWSRIPPDAQASWLSLARSTDPLDVWYMFIRNAAKA
jgi:hypothetical protein